MKDNIAISRTKKIARMLGVDYILKGVSVNKKMTADGGTYMSFNIDNATIVISDKSGDTIIHEVLHLCFKNTIYMSNKLMNKKAYEAFTMIHEQEIDRLSIKIANIFKKNNI